MRKHCFLFFLSFLCGACSQEDFRGADRQGVEVRDSAKAQRDYARGIFLMERGDFDRAAVYFHRATESVGSEISNEQEVNYFHMAWDAYFSQNKFGDCLSISRQFKALLDQEKDFAHLALAYYFDENVYKKIPDYPKALANNRLRIKMLEKAGDSLRLAPALISQAQLKYYYLDAKEESFRLMDELIQKEAQLTNDFKRQLYGNYGVFLFFEGQFEQSLAHYLKGLSFTHKTPDTPDKNSLLANAYSNITEVCIALKDYPRAAAYIDSIKALGISNIDYRIQKNALKYQLQLASLTNDNIGEVTAYLDTIFKYQDDQYVDRFNSELVALTKANRKEKVLIAEKQATEIKNLKLQSRLLLFGVLGSLLAAIALLFYRQRKHRYEKQSLQMQQRLLRSQMNPHFTFNILYAIQNLIKKNQETAITYLFKFSRLLRLVLENSMLNYVPLEKELESLRKYLDLQLLRFPGKFTYAITLDHLEEDDLIFIPPMLLQPFVENSIEHGFSGIDYPGKISITLSQIGEHLECAIEDNGRGIMEGEEVDKKSASTQLISNFLEKATSRKVEIYNKKAFVKNQTGVIVKFSIPYKLTEDD